MRHNFCVSGLSPELKKRYLWEENYIIKNVGGYYQSNAEQMRAIYNLIRGYTIRDMQDMLRETGGRDEHFFFEQFLHMVIKEAREDIAATGAIEYVPQNGPALENGRHWMTVMPA